MRNVLLWGEMQQHASVLCQERADKEGEVNDARHDKKKKKLAGKTPLSG